MIDVVSYLNNGLAPASEKRVAEKDLGKDSFMELLVAQMSNQNPLEPMENTEFIAQLAQFSSLEQMQNVASGIELLALTQTAATNSSMVNLIGRRVIVPGNNISLDGEKGAEIRFDLEGDAIPGKIVISDENGSTVRTIQLDSMTTGTNSINFDGKDNDGNLLEAGNYTYSVVNSSNEDVEGVTKYSNYLVKAVRYEGTSIMLKSGSTEIDLADVSEVIQH
jgi:flagellar basal-body rod modification protein FlgD